MFRLYDRHLGAGWHEHSAEARIWEGIENVDDGELWETHLSLKSRLLEFVRRRAVEQAERRGESPEILQRFGRVLSPDALTIGFARRFATYKRADLILGRHRKARLHGERPEASGAVRFRRQGASPRRTRQAGAAADCGVDAQTGSLPTNSSSSKTTTSTSAVISCRASMFG